MTRRAARTSSGWRADWLRALLAVLLASGLSVAAPLPARALTPESPEIKQAVARAVGYLSGPAIRETRPGGLALVGLTLLKCDVPPEHPRIQECIAAVRALVPKLTEAQPDEVYTVGLSIIFLANVDPDAYRADIQALLDNLLARQKPHGGWGYPSKPTGDTSMTQYAVLALWEVAAAGFDVPIEAWEKVCNWFLRTQDPSGAFGYQGSDPGSFTLVRQPEVRHSLAAAGLGSLYLCRLHLGIGPPIKERAGNAALRRVETESPTPRSRLTSRIDETRFTQALGMGDRWFDKNFKVEVSQWNLYYLYTLERYQTFKEFGREQPGDELAWYNEGARWLLDNQDDAGTWYGKEGIGPATAFATLFLVRSTRKSLQKGGHLGPGTLVGGRGLPDETADVRLRDGKVVAQPLSGPAEQLLALIENPDHDDFLSAVEGFESFAVEADEATLNQHAVRLQKLAGAERPEARLAAVRALGRTRDLDHVPTLIWALTDPDVRVVREARDALRFISRKFDGFGLPDNPTPPQVRAVVDRWKAWYEALRPEAQFED